MSGQGEDQFKAFISEKREGDYYVSTYKHHQSLYEDAKNLTTKDFQTIIPLAVSALNNLNQSLSSVEYQEMIVKEVARHTVFFDADKARLEKDKSLALLKKDKEYETILAPLNSRVEGLVNENSKLLAQLELANYYKDQIHQNNQTLKKESEADTRAFLEKQSYQHTLELERLRETLENQGRERVAQCDKQHNDNSERMRILYEEQIAKYEKNTGSSNKGKQGEKEFADLVTQFTDWAKVQDVSKTSHSTDMRCKIRNCQTLFEIKKYSEDVPTKEVAKFERDMEENQDCPMGVFISLHTNITSKKSGNFMTSSWSPKSQLLIYVNSFYNHSAEDVLTFIDMCSDTAWKLFKSSMDTPDESEMTSELQGRIEQAKVFIEKDIKRLAELITKMNHNKKFLIDSITKQNADCVGDIQQNRHSLQCMLEVLLGPAESIAQDADLQPVTKKARGKPPKGQKA